MSLRFARFLLLFAAFWLPVQAMAAMSMPLCRHAQEQAMAAVEVQQDAAAVHCHETTAPDQTVHDAGCDNCVQCHLACAGFLPSAPLVTVMIPAGYAYVLPAIVAPPSHISEPPQHPPRGKA